MLRAALPSAASVRDGAWVWARPESSGTRRKVAQTIRGKERFSVFIVSPALLHSSAPVSRTAFAVRDSNDLHHKLPQTINENVWKAAQQDVAGREEIDRVASWR